MISFRKFTVLVSDLELEQLRESLTQNTGKKKFRRESKLFFQGEIADDHFTIYPTILSSNTMLRPVLNGKFVEADSKVYTELRYELPKATMEFALYGLILNFILILAAILIPDLLPFPWWQLLVAMCIMVFTASWTFKGKTTDATDQLKKMWSAAELDLQSQK